MISFTATCCSERYMIGRATSENSERSEHFHSARDLNIEMRVETRFSNADSYIIFECNESITKALFPTVRQVR